MPEYINIIIFLPFRTGEGGRESPNLNQNTLCSLQLRKLSTFSDCNFIRSPGSVTVGGGGVPEPFAFNQSQSFRIQCIPGKHRNSMNRSLVKRRTL